MRPKLIVCGGSAYPRTVEADRFREIADEVGALLMTDMAHFAGLVAAGLHPNPVPHSHFVTSTTHKTLAGPRAGFVLCSEEHAQALDRALFPGHAGRAADAHDRGEGDVLPDRRRPTRSATYQQQVRTNADTLAAGLIGGGFDVLTGGTDTHLVQLDLRATEWTGLAAQERLEECRLTVNRNTVPFDERPPMVASGVRHRHAGGDDARLRRGRLPRGRGDHRRRARTTTPTCAALARARERRSATAARCTRASAATRPTSRDDVGVSVDRGHAPARPAQARAAARRQHRHRQLPPARQRADAAAHLRGDEGHGRSSRSRSRRRSSVTRAERIPGKKIAVCPILRAGHGHARRRALADPGRARRLHRALPQRGDARAGRVLREAPGRHRRARRARCSTRCSRPATRPPPP